MKGELFKGVKQWNFSEFARQSERDGFECKFPVFFHDTTSVGVVYTAATSRVKPLLPHPEMSLTEVRPGRCLTTVNAFEHRESDIGPYNELAIGFPVVFGKRQIPGLTLWSQTRKQAFSTYCWQLPVTTEAPRNGGVQLYGLPKFLADVTFDKGDEYVSCLVSEKGETILTLRGKVLPSQGESQQRAVTYSLRDGIPLATTTVTHALEYAQTREKQAASVELGSHAIAETLRQIELGPQPVVYQYSPAAELIVFAGRNLMDG